MTNPGETSIRKSMAERADPVAESQKAPANPEQGGSGFLSGSDSAVQARLESAPPGKNEEQSSKEYGKDFDPKAHKNH